MKRHCRAGLSAVAGAILLGVLSAPASLRAADTDTSSRLEQLRKNQDSDIERLRSHYDERARKECPRRPDGSIDTDSRQYKRLYNDYSSGRQKITDAYLKQEPRLKDFQPGNEIDGVRSTGSNPRNVRADADWTADSDEAFNRKVEQWRQRGDDLDLKDHKVVNKTTDESLWKPGTEAGSDSLVQDGDAYGTQGGREAVTRQKGQKGHKKTGDGIRDAAGEGLDHKKKYVDARQRGDLKDQAKAVVKSGQDLPETDTTRKAKKLKNYGDEITSGVSDLGDTPEERTRKVEDFQQKLDNEMDRNAQHAEERGARTDDTRRKIADSARKVETSGDEAWDKARKKANYGEQDSTSEALEKRREAVEDSNRKTREEIERRQRGSDADASKTAGTGDGDAAVAAGRKQTADGDDGARRIADVETDGRGRRQAPDAEQPAPARSGTDADGADPKQRSQVERKTDSSKTNVKGGKLKQIGDGYNTADDVVDWVERGTTYVEGLKEGDHAKAATPIVGQDTAGRTRMQNAKEWSELEGKAEEARSDEVSSELEAKLRRMGASKDEAREARNRYDSGDKQGFRRIVQDVKDRGGKDAAPRGLTPDGPTEEEDGVAERLKEGGKQALDYVDGGTRVRAEESSENLKGLDQENAQINDLIQEEVDQQVVKKMMRKGVPRKEAQAALEQKRNGDPSAWNNLRDNLPGKSDSPRHDGEGLSADGKTQTYDGKDMVEERTSDAWKSTKQKGNTILKPVDMIYEWQEENHLEEMRDNERAAGFYQAMREWGADKKEALDAARQFAETGDRSKSSAIYKKYLQQNLEQRAAEKKATAIKQAEAESDAEVTPEMTENGGKTAIDEYSDRREEARTEATEGSYAGMDAEQELRAAGSAGEDARRRAEYERNRGGEDARKWEEESARDIAEGDRDNSWGKHMGDAVEQGVSRGLGRFGSELGRHAAGKVADEIWKPEKVDVSKTAGKPGARAVSAKGSARKPGKTPASADAGGKPAAAASAPQTAAPADEATGEVMITTAGDMPMRAAVPNKEEPAPASGIRCPECGGTEFGPYEVVGERGNMVANDRRCLTCGHMGGVMVKEAPTEPAPKPAPDEQVYGKCPTCGSSILYDPIRKIWSCVQCGPHATQ